VSGAAQNTSSGTAPALYRTINDDDIEFRYAYSIDSYTASIPLVDVNFRYNTTSGERLLVRFRLDQAELRYYNGTTWTTYTDTNVDTTAGTKYNVRVEADGANIKVWRSTGGALETLLFSRTDMPTYNGNRLQFAVSADTVASLDDIMILASDSDINRTTSFTVATNNELSTMGDYNGSNTFAYDAWGRMTSKTRTGVSATYDYGYGQKLTKVTSTYPDEGTVTYQYGGEELLRSMSVSGGAFIWYNYSYKEVLNEENQGGTIGAGSLIRYFVSGFSDSVGSNPATDPVRYSVYLPNSGPRLFYAQDKSSLGTIDYKPTGGFFHVSTDSSIVPRSLSLFVPASAGLLGGCGIAPPIGGGANIYQSIRISGTFDTLIDQSSPENIITISWTADSTCRCTEAWFAQIACSRYWGPLKNRPWHVDWVAGGDNPYPWYPYGQPNWPHIEMSDSPTLGMLTGKQHFEVCSICRAGHDKGVNYGCVKWDSHTYDPHTARISVQGYPTEPSLWYWLLLGDAPPVTYP